MGRKIHISCTFAGTHRHVVSALCHPTTILHKNWKVKLTDNVTEATCKNCLRIRRRSVG